MIATNWQRLEGRGGGGDQQEEGIRGIAWPGLKIEEEQDVKREG